MNAVFSFLNALFDFAFWVRPKGLAVFSEKTVSPGSYRVVEIVNMEIGGYRIELLPIRKEKAEPVFFQSGGLKQPEISFANGNCCPLKVGMEFRAVCKKGAMAEIGVDFYRL